MWPGIEHIFVENDPFCQAVLKKHYPNSTIHGDIRQFIKEAEDGFATDTNMQRDRTGFESIQRANEEVSEWYNNAELGNADTFILTAGVPCQPASVAGRRRGKEDDRWLWPQTFRVIELLRPEWVILENVRGLITLEQGMVFKELLFELENLHYETRQYIIPACAVGAPHRRDRVWIVAYAKVIDDRGEAGELSQSYEQKTAERQEERTSQSSSPGFRQWNKDWREVALATCHDRVDDGVPRRMVRLPDGTRISHAKWRKEALKAYGNAIVPAVAQRVMYAISCAQPPLLSDTDGS